MKSGILIRLLIPMLSFEEANEITQISTRSEIMCLQTRNYYKIYLLSLQNYFEGGNFFLVFFLPF